MAKFEQTKLEIIKKRKRKKVWQKVVSVLCSVAVFCTVYALVLPAITITNDQLDNLDQTQEVIDEYANNIPSELPETVNERVVLVAKNQLNTDIENNIYVEWLNNKYEDVTTNDNIAFINYVLNYSKIENNLPIEANALDLLMNLSESDLNESIYTLEDHEPEKGDLVFLWNTEKLDDLNNIEDELEYENAYKELYSVGIILDVDLENNIIEYVTGADNNEHIISLCSIEMDNFDVASYFSLSSFEVIEEIEETEDRELDNDLYMDFVGELKSDGTPFEASANESDTKPNNYPAFMLLSDPEPQPINANTYVQEAKIQWRTSSTSDWIDLSADNPMPADAQLLININYDGINPKALQAANYKMLYTPDVNLNNVKCSAPIKSKDGSTIGTVSTTDDGKLMLTFNDAWVDGLVASNIGQNNIKSVNGDFEYEAKLDLSKIDDTSTNIQLNLGGAKIDVPLPGDNHARYGDLTIEKSIVGTAENKLQKDANGFYLEYLLTVKSGNLPMPSVKVVDTLTNADNFKLLNGSVSLYPTVTGAKPTSDNVTSTGEYFVGSGSVYLTNENQIYTNTTTLEKNANYATPAGSSANVESSLVWDLGDLEANQTKTLKYKVYVNDNYTGLVHKNALEALKNDAELSSNGYPHGNSPTDYLPKATAGVVKKNITGGQGFRTENGKHYVDFVLEVNVDANNEYDLTNVKVKDTLERIPAAYRQYVKYVASSLEVYKEYSDQEYKQKIDSTTLNSYKENNPVIADNNTPFEVYLGNLQKGEKRYIKYTVEIDIQQSQLVYNGAVGIHNDAQLYNDDTKVTSNNTPYSTSQNNIDISNQTWSRKASGGQTTTEKTFDLSTSTDVYDSKVKENGMLKKITDAGSFTVPEGSYEYKVVVNEKGEWDVSSATMKDTIGDNDVAGSNNRKRYLEFIDYVRIDVYDKVDNASGDFNNLSNSLEGQTIKKTIWVNIDKQGSFAFSGKEIGLTDSDAYVLTYYAKVVDDAGSFGTATVSNSFNVSGSVGYGGNSYTLNGVTYTISTSVKEPGVNNPTKDAWYYDADDQAFAKYHNGQSNGALYWVIKCTGDKIPVGTKFQESTRVGTGHPNNYLRNNESLIGFYAIALEGSTNKENADEFIAKYPTIDDFYNDLQLGNIRTVPTTTYSSTWAGYSSSQYGNNGQHFDFTVTFNSDYKINSDEALYLLVKTDPVSMPANGTKTEYKNKVNFVTPAMNNPTYWPNDDASQIIKGPNADLDKRNGNVFIVEDTGTTDSNLYTNDLKETYAKNAKFSVITEDGLTPLPSVYDVATNNTKNQNSELSYASLVVTDSVSSINNTYKNGTANTTYSIPGYNDQFINYRFSDGTYVTWLLDINKGGATSGEYSVVDNLPEGVELAYVKTFQVDNASGDGTNGSYPYKRNISTIKYNDPQNLNNIRVRATGENKDYENDGWTHKVVVSNRNGQIYWQDTLTDYYVNDKNQIKILFPNIELNRKVVMQVVCRVTDPAIYFTDVDFVNTAVIYDSNNRIVESDSSLVNVETNNLQKTDLANYTGNKLENINIPYQIIVNSAGADMADGSDYIPTALIDNMSSNLSIDLNSLRIYAVDPSIEFTVPTSDPTLGRTNNYYQQYDENGLPLYVSTNRYVVNDVEYYIPNYIKDEAGKFIQDDNVKKINLDSSYYASGLNFDIPASNDEHGYRVYTTSVKNQGQGATNYAYEIKGDVTSTDDINSYLIYSGATFKEPYKNANGDQLYIQRCLKQFEVDQINSDGQSTGNKEYHYVYYNMYQEVDSSGNLLYYDNSNNKVTTETSRPVLTDKSVNSNNIGNKLYITTETTNNTCFDKSGNIAYHKTNNSGEKLYYTDNLHENETITFTEWPVLTTDVSENHTDVEVANIIYDNDVVYGNIAHGNKISGIRVAVEQNRNESSELDGTTNIMFYGLPDNKTIYIRYNTKLIASSGSTNSYSNNVSWKGYEPPELGETSRESIEYVTSASAGTETHGAVKITKYDGNQTQKVLDGAEFTLYRAKYRLPEEGYLIWENDVSDAEKAKRHPAVYLYLYDENGNHRLDGTGDYMHEELVVTRDKDGFIKSLRKNDGTIVPINTRGLHHDLDFDENGKPQVYTEEVLGRKITGIDGIVTYGLAQDEDAIHFNKVYVVVETKAPNGYEVDSKPYFFVVPNQKQSGNKANYFYHELESEYSKEVEIVRTSTGDTLTFNLNVFDYKASVKVNKLFGGNAGENIYKIGTYKFGIWNASDVIITGNKQNPIIEAKLDEVTISYTENDFGYYIGNSMQYTQYKNENSNWKSRDVKLTNGTEIIGEWSTLSGQVPVGVTYGILPNHEKTAIFQNLTFDKSYYVYELDSAGRPILNNTSGVINGNTFVTTYDGTGEVVNLLTPTKDADNNTITPVLNVTNNSYQVMLTKKLLNLAGGATQVTGNYYFGIWKANAEGEFDLTKSPIAIKGIQWQKNEVTSEKSLVFDNLQLGTYAIYEIASPTETTPIMQGGMLDANGNHFKVVYQDNNIVIIAAADTQESNVHIMNNATVALPQSGGPGDLVFIVGGMALVLLGLLLSIKKQKRTNY